MNLEKIAATITAEDLRKLNESFKEKQNKIPTYYFSVVTLNDLKKLVNLKKIFTEDVFNEWFNFNLLFFVLSLCLPCGWLVLFIEALVLFPNIEQEGSQQWRANLKGDSKYQLS